LRVSIVSQICLLPLTPMLSSHYSLCWSRRRAGTPFALMLANKTRLASRGGRNPTSTGVPVLGGQFRKGGLHQPPFLFSSVVGGFPRVSHVFKAQGFGPAPFRFREPDGKFLPASTAFGRLGRTPTFLARPEMDAEKSERPTGGSAARAWGNGRVRGLKSVRFFIPHGAGRRLSRCARKQQNNAQEQTPDNHPNGSKSRAYFRSLDHFAGCFVRGR
jgi:hypothetical protein